MMQLMRDFVKGLWKENPVLVLLLGTCPTLAVTTGAVNALGMGLATTFVLVCSNVVISCIAPAVPKKIRIPVYIVVIAAFVTIIDMMMQAWAPKSLYDALGIFIQLIVVNCIVLGRAEAFASKNNPLRSAADGLGMGLGFTLALLLLGCLREFLTGGSLFGYKVITAWTTDFLLPSSAPGAFLLLGCVLAAMNVLNARQALKRGERYIPPQGLDCRHCRICSFHEDKEK